MNGQEPFSLRGRNPDVLTCIANLSNDEVFTPPEFANRMLDNLAEAWAADNGGAHVYTDFATMVREEPLDGVLLATWPNQHRAQIAALLDAGVRHILCEKSLALTGREGWEIFRLAQQAGAYIMEGFMYRHHPVIRRMEALLPDLGPVDAVRACFSSHDPEVEDPDNTARDWRQRKECGGGIPYDFACYAVNACGLFSGGVPVRAFAVGGESPVYGTINRLYGMIQYANGCVGIIESSKKATMSQELEVTGPLRTLYLPVAWTIHGDSLLAVKDEGPWPLPTAETETIPDADPYRLQLENFAAVIRGDAAPACRWRSR